MTTIAKIIERIQRTGEISRCGPNASSAIWRAFWPAERYVIDFASDYKGSGWEQFDTSQDAHYFGVWVNRTALMTLTYCEGDWSLVLCHDAAGYNYELGEMIRTYAEGFIAKAYGPDGCTILCQDRTAFLIN